MIRPGDKLHLFSIPRAHWTDYRTGRPIVEGCVILRDGERIASLIGVEKTPLDQITRRDYQAKPEWLKESITLEEFDLQK